MTRPASTTPLGAGQPSCEPSITLKIVSDLLPAALGVAALMLAMGAVYVSRAIHARAAKGPRGLLIFTLVGLLAIVATVVLLLIMRLGMLALLVTPAIGLFLAPLCAVASAIVELRARQRGGDARRALAVGAVLCFGAWGIVMLLAAMKGLGSLNPDGRHRG